MSYAAKEIFYTLQGEGLRAGRPAVFCRFAGCNLWSGREEDRERATCRFCDTDFVGTDGALGGRYEAQALAEQIAALWPAGQAHRYVVLTGGEPLLQVDEPLLQALHAQGFEIALETNGSLPVPAGVDWICVSPKAGADWVQRRGHELKLVFPQPGLMPGDIGEVDFEHLLLQPMDSPLRAQHTRAAIDWCMAHPRWRLSLQTHKILNIP
ncbi:7-carboxy-7-deazaguanine synthase [Hydrogenophaga sp.]|uniref:7-carboxy-7-deazaguanine synthase n=1 Tax=Hydrogenophaga sp. TaxID=1904254 RepID=UPI0035B37B91